MKLWLSWTASLGMAGACMVAIGCGGGGVPDTSNEGQPVAGGAATSDNAAPAPEPTPEVASAPAKEKDEAAAPAEEPSKPAASQAPAKKEGGSATAEMLALATTPSTAPNQPAGGGAGAAENAAGGAPPQPGGAAGPGQMGGMPAGMAAMMQGRPGMGPGAPGAGGPPGAPGGAGGPGGMPPGMMAQMQQGGMMRPPTGNGPSPGDMAKMMAGRMQGNMANRAPGGDNVLSPGGGSGPGGPGGAGAGGGPADNRSPENAVRFFLKALKDKDRDALNEATAGHAYLEAGSERNREMFKKIFDLELSDSEFDDLAKKLDGYRIVSYNPPKSTGRLDIVIQKQGDRGAFYRRRVTVRKEKKGWGVLDISGAEEFKSMINYGQRRR
jgi:hypothetical protein